MITKYAVIGLAVLLGLSGIKIYFQAGQIADLKLEAEKLDKAHQAQLIDKLKAQREAFDQQLVNESKRARALEARNAELLKEVSQLADYGNRLAESLRRFLNGMFHGPPGETGRLVPANSEIPADGRGHAG